MPDHITEKRRRIEGMVSGSFAGAFSKTLTAPFDRVKILCQTGRATSPLNAANLVWTSEGWRGFFRGNLVNVMRIVPNRGVLFMCSDFIKDSMRNKDELLAARRARKSPPPLTPWQYVCAGALSGATTVVATYPMDLVRARLTSSLGANSKYTGIIQTLKLSFQEGGFRALYRGMGPALAGAFPYEGIRFGVYDTLKSHYTTDSTPLYVNISLGAIAGVTAGVVLYPNDTVRRRMQADAKIHTTSENRAYSSAFDCYRTLYREHGIRIFYRGLTANVIRAAPSTAFQFGAFELAKRFFVSIHHAEADAIAKQQAASKRSEIDDNALP